MPLPRSRASQQLDLPLARPVRPRALPGRRRIHRVVGLFAGIGGLELGLERAGHRTVLLSEKDEAAQEVLRNSLLKKPARRVPIEPDVRDVRRTLRTKYPGVLEKATLIAAGFPCQDLSQAGRTVGIDGRNSGLVGELFKILDVFLAAGRAPWVVLENVSFMLHLDRGEAMNRLAEELEARKYAWAYRVVDSRAFGVPQRRLRVFLVACRSHDPRRVLLCDDAGEPAEPIWDARRPVGFYWTEGNRGVGWAVDAIPALKVGSGFGIPSPPAVWLPSGEIVVPTIRAAERLQGFPPHWTQPADDLAPTKQRWRLVGNAVTVAAAKWLGDRLAAPAKAYTAGGKRLRAGDPWPKAAWNLGPGRHSAPVSSWPVRMRGTSLATLIRNANQPLSARAASGFLARYRNSPLTERPLFIAALEAHIAAVSGGGPGRRGVR